MCWLNSVMNVMLFCSLIQLSLIKNMSPLSLLLVFVVFSLPGTQRGEALCNCPLAQHCAEEEEDGTSSSNVTSALRLPSWSQTLLSARRSSSHKQLLLWHTVTFVTSLEAVGVLNADAYHRKLHFHLNIKELSFFSSFCHFSSFFLSQNPQPPSLFNQVKVELR